VAESTTIMDRAEITEAQFESISRTVRELCGINLHTGKKELVKARLGKRLRALGLADFGQYLDHVARDASGDELALMLDLLSTNLTYFFREPQHLAYLRADVLPEVLSRHQTDRRLRIWSAGCSSGEEPYSIAITLAETMPDLDRWDVAILATDLSSRVLRAAREGVYSRERMRQSPAGAMGKYLLSVPGERDAFRVRDDLRAMVQFARLNLMAGWPMKGPFDVIFCRNVMIYFDKPTQARLVERFWEILSPGGTLFIGHSESLAGVRHRFQYVHPTVYRKP
jgi:chemotaxis protein methyltransferase CheR